MNTLLTVLTCVIACYMQDSKQKMKDIARKELELTHKINSFVKKYDTPNSCKVSIQRICQ